MKRALGRILLSTEFQISTFAPMVRAIIRRTRGIYKYSPNFLTDFGVIERPHYAWCMLRSVELAQKLGYNAISGIEFGVAGGNGLLFMRSFADAIEEASGIKIECYGFDTGKGMPEPHDWRDVPYWFQARQYAMNQELLKSRLGKAKLIIGDIKDTVGSFISDFNPAPIGFVFNDTDYHSSTLASLQLYRYSLSHPQNFAPRIFQYYDDVIGSQWEMYGEQNGQLAAINDFNRDQNDVIIHRNQNLINDLHRSWRHQIFYCHLLKHPEYSTYIGGTRQEHLKSALALK